ncbi:MAG: NifU N-terminal domain-containing protein [Phycisphaerales bacterium JB040]
MALRVVRIEPTPNPNAVKVVVQPAPAGGIRSYFNAGQAAGEADPLAHALFAIPGVTSLLIHETFVSVNKSPDAGWGPIKRAAERVIEAHD